MMTVAKAVSLLADKYGPTRYFSLSMQVHRHSNSPPEVNWVIYRESSVHTSGRNFQANELYKAVEMAMADNDKPDDLDAVQALLDTPPAAIAGCDPTIGDEIMAASIEFGEGMAKEPPF